MLKRVLFCLIGFYQKAISPLLPARCRYYPTCSHYGRQALAWHDTWHGLLLLVRRVLSCHPWGGSGVDFVPVPMYRYRYDFLSQSPKARDVLIGRNDYISRLNHLMKNS